jgi:hypothetical protein
MNNLLKKIICALLIIAMLGAVAMLASCNSDDGETDATAPPEKNTDREALVSVPRAIVNLKKGDKITVDHLLVCYVDRDEVPTGAIVDIMAMIGKYVKRDIAMGGYVYAEDLSISAVIPDVEKDPLEDIRDELKGELRDELEEEIRIEIENELRDELLNGGSNASDKSYVIITDHLAANTGKDVSSEIQKVINENPRKTIYFPDGEYIISKPIYTSSNPQKAVSLHLSNFAIIKASDDWSSDEAMIRLGGDPDRVFTTGQTGSNYYLYGGCIDGSNIAKGVSIDSGRETSIRNVSIKFATLGLHVKYNSEYASNDADIDTVNIIGPYAPDTIGLLVEGFDNTFTNMRIAGFEVGVKLTGSGNFMRNLHPLYSYDTCAYADSIGFYDLGGDNWYDICYPDNFAVGFRMAGHTVSTYNDCFCYWYSSSGMTEIAFMSDGKFNSVLNNCKATFRSDAIGKYLVVGETGGGGVVQSPLFDVKLNNDDSYKDYLEGKVVWKK